MKSSNTVVKLLTASRLSFKDLYVSARLYLEQVNKPSNDS